MKYFDGDVEFHCEDCPEFYKWPDGQFEHGEGYCENGKGVVLAKMSHCGYLYRLKELHGND
jgi:hypothetical protein